MYFVAHAIMSRTATPQVCHGNGMFSWADNDNLDEVSGALSSCLHLLTRLVD